MRTASAGVWGPQQRSVGVTSAGHRSILEDDVDVLGLRVGEDLVEPLLAAEPAVLHAAERCTGDVPRHLVHPNIAGFYVASEAMCGRKVLGEHASGEPVPDAVGDANRLGVVAEPDDRKNWAKDLLLSKARVRLHVREDSRRIKSPHANGPSVSLVPPATMRAPSSRPMRMYVLILSNCCPFTIAPVSVASSSGIPERIASTFVASR